MTTEQYREASLKFNTGFVRRQFDKTSTFTCAKLNEFDCLKHGFTTRVGGISDGGCSSLNLCFTRDDSDENVLKNFRILCGEQGLDIESMALVNHEHSNNVLVIDKTAGGCGILRDPLQFSDGFVTNDPDITLVTSHADCSAYFFFDPVTRSIGLCHAGWKGTIARIGKNVVEAMTRNFGADPADIITCVGPCICGKCFEDDYSLGERFVREFGADCLITSVKGEKAYLDIEAAGAIQMLEAGINPEHITLMHACTYELDDDFFSYRRDRGITGSMIAYMKIYNSSVAKQ